MAATISGDSQSVLQKGQALIGEALEKEIKQGGVELPPAAIKRIAEEIFTKKFLGGLFGSDKLTSDKLTNRLTDVELTKSPVEAIRSFGAEPKLPVSEEDVEEELEEAYQKIEAGEEVTEETPPTPITPTPTPTPKRAERRPIPMVTAEEGAEERPEEPEMPEETERLEKPERGEAPEKPSAPEKEVGTEQPTTEKPEKLARPERTEEIPAETEAAPTQPTEPYQAYGEPTPEEARAPERPSPAGETGPESEAGAPGEGDQQPPAPAEQQPQLTDQPQKLQKAERATRQKTEKKIKPLQRAISLLKKKRKLLLLQKRIIQGKMIAALARFTFWMIVCILAIIIAIPLLLVGFGEAIIPWALEKIGAESAKRSAQMAKYTIELKKVDLKIKQINSAIKRLEDIIRTIQGTANSKLRQFRNRLMSRAQQAGEQAVG